jgi:hypothetical protein
MLKWKQKLEQCLKTKSQVPIAPMNAVVDQEVAESNVNQAVPRKTDVELPVFGLSVFSRRSEALQRVEELFSVYGLNAMKEWAETIEKGETPPKSEE